MSVAICDHVVPSMMDCIFELWAKINHSLLKLLLLSVLFLQWDKYCIRGQTDGLVVDNGKATNTIQLDTDACSFLVYRLSFRLSCSRFLLLYSFLVTKSLKYFSLLWIFQPMTAPNPSPWFYIHNPLSTSLSLYYGASCFPCDITSPHSEDWLHISPYNPFSV